MPGPPRRRPLTAVPDPEDESVIRRRKEAAKTFDLSCEALMISVQVWTMAPTAANKNSATRALTNQLRAWKLLQDLMP